MTTITDDNVGTIEIGDHTVRRLGFGAMRITGPGIWGPPADHDEAIAVLRRAVELGVNLIDTADSYGPDVSEELIAEALHPYPDDLLIATKGGLTRTGPGPVAARRATGAPAGGLRGLAAAPAARDDRALPAPQPRLRRCPTSARSPRSRSSRTRARSSTSASPTCRWTSSRPRARSSRWSPSRTASTSPIAIRRTCSSAARSSGSPSSHGRRLATGELAEPGGPLDRIASAHDATPGQVALAWLLARSAVIVPIPGTSSVEHLEENLGAAELELSEEELAQLESAAD